MILKKSKEGTNGQTTEKLDIQMLGPRIALPAAFGRAFKAFAKAFPASTTFAAWSWQIGAGLGLGFGEPMAQGSGVQIDDAHVRGDVKLPLTGGYSLESDVEGRKTVGGEGRADGHGTG